MSKIKIALISSLYFTTSLGAFAAGPAPVATKGKGSSVSASSGNSQNSDSDDSDSLSTAQAATLAALGGIGAGGVATGVYTHRKAKAAQDVAAQKIKDVESVRDKANNEFEIVKKDHDELIVQHDKAQKELSEVEIMSKMAENLDDEKEKAAQKTLKRTETERDNALEKLKVLEKNHEKVKTQLGESENSVSHLKDQVEAVHKEDTQKNHKWVISEFFKATQKSEPHQTFKE